MAKSKTYTVKLGKKAFDKRQELRRYREQLDNGVVQSIDVPNLDVLIVKSLSRLAGSIIDTVYKEISKKSEVS